MVNNGKDEFEKYFDISLSFTDKEELSKVNKSKSIIIEDKYQLDTLDSVVCSLVGITAGMMDLLLIKNPKDGGFLNRKVDGEIGKHFSRDKISILERANKVPYDFANSSNLAEEVSGLN